ncbi:amidase domain-containing protein [Orenia marismortui]|uniref:amidase domain-containing protein n=1 Tax=Orenia marismortui TaxID=46469 RepID=UPI000380E68E|nr:amidase domain-containing protein [Orenia marismortui]
MFILISIKKRLLILFILFFLICGLGAYSKIFYTKTSTVVTGENLTEFLKLKIQEIFDTRNKSLLNQNNNILKKLYNRENKTGIWAYEHAFKKMKYLHQWSNKQGVEFKNIDSQIILRRIKKKQDRFSVTLLVSTKYQYTYIDSPKKYNTFRIGTYHVLDLIPQEDRLVIAKEWYRDPFADSLHLNKSKNNRVKEKILSEKAKDLSKLNPRRLKALEYLNQYCGAANPPDKGFKYNNKYRNYNYQGGDCANFASQVLYEGGKFKKNSIWNYSQGSGSKAWVNAHSFNRYMIYSNRASKIAHGNYEQILKYSYKLLPGDYIGYEKKGKVVHISVISGFDSKGYALVNCHNADRYRVPWDLGWSDRGIKFWLVRVHY